MKLADRLDWPSNIWMGVSVEDEKSTWRVDALQLAPAAVRFISAEPLLGNIAPDLSGMGRTEIAGADDGQLHN